MMVTMNEQPCKINEILEKLGIRLNEQRKSGKYCDLTLTTQDGGSFTVHKCVLEAICPFFEKLFSNEKAASILIGDCSSPVLGKIIEFIYTGFTEITPDCAKEALDKSLSLELNKLVEMCTEVLMENVKPDNCFELLSYSESFHHGEPLKKKCMKIISENIETLKDSTDFTKMPLESMKFLCSKNRNKYDDEKVYSAIVNWVTFDTDSRKENIPDLLDDIRFENISYEFGAKNLLNNNPLVENEEFISKFTNVLTTHWDEQVKSGRGQDFILPSKSGLIYSIIGKDMKVYNNSEYTFSPAIAEMSKDCQQFGYTVLDDENFFICGGIVNAEKEIRDCEYYSFNRKCWEPLPPMKYNRRTHGACKLNDKIYVCGGINDKTVEIFDIGKNMWFDGPSLISNASWPGLCSWNNCIYVLKRSFQQFDPRGGCWSLLPNCDVDGEILSAIAYDDKIYGFTTNDIVTYDIRNGTWAENTELYERPYNADNIPKTCLVKNHIYIMAQNNYGQYLLHSYNASNLSLRYFSPMTLEEGSQRCLALFTL